MSLLCLFIGHDWRILITESLSDDPMDEAPRTQHTVTCARCCRTEVHILHGGMFGKQLVWVSDKQSTAKLTEAVKAKVKFGYLKIKELPHA